MKLLSVFCLVLAVAGVVGCGNDDKNESTKMLNQGNKELGAKQFESAIASFNKSIEKNPKNHLAWYGLGLAEISKQDPDKASQAFAKSVEFAPDQAMYQMYYGLSLLEKSIASARDAQAQKLGKKPQELSVGDVDTSQINFDSAQRALQESLKLNADLWRAHFHLGRIYRATDKPKEAADEFSKALQANPREWAPYVALGELYRKWDYTDQAIKVAQQGTVNVVGQNEVSDIWHVLGMAYDDKGMYSEAIDAFTKAIESRKDNHKSKFQRGQDYFRKADFVHAKRDLEEFSKSGGASMEFQKQEATKMLMDIAAKTAAAENPGGAAKPSPEDVAKGKSGKKGGGFQPPKR